MRRLPCTFVIATLLIGCVPEAADDDGLDPALGEVDEGLIAFCTTPVTFTDVAFEVPTVSGHPHAEFHQRGGLTYVAGEYLDVVFTLPSCPKFSGVSNGDVMLPEDGGIEQGDHYQVVNDFPLPGGGHRVRVRLWLENSGDGGRANLRVWAHNMLIDGGKSIDIAWVGVEDISRASQVSLSAVELKNNIASSTYARFGDTGWEHDADGAETGWHDFDYQALSVSIDDSIHFHAKQQYRVYSTPWNCDVTATVDGRFRLSRYDADPPAEDWQLRVDWIKPSADSPLPFSVTLADDNFCTLGLPDIVAPLLTLLDNTITSSIKDRIAAGLVDNFQCDAPAGISCGSLIEKFEYKSGELIAVLDDTLLDLQGVGLSLTVRAPYVASVAPGAAYQPGLALPPGDRVLITQEGLVKGCHSDVGNPNTCNGTTPKRFGGAGLFNLSNKTTWPVRDPYEYGWPPLPQREKALAAHVGVIRTASQLPSVNSYGGALLGRVGSRRYDLSRPCIVEVPPPPTPTSPPPVLLLGRNDRTSGGVPYGSGQALVTVRFTPYAESCPTF